MFRLWLISALIWTVMKNKGGFNVKRFICVFLLIVLLPVFSFAESPLSDNEQKYVGSWALYADNGKGTIYSFLLTFLDNMNVVQSSLTFKNGELSSNNKASGDWIGFTDKTILLSLAGTDMTAMIKDNGYLYLYFLDDLALCGVYSKCEDMTSVMGW